MKQKLFSLWLLLSVAVGLSAYDFYKDGLCYRITSSTAPYTVEVTYERDDEPTYKGLTSATIPESVTYNYNEQVYSVTSIGSYAFSGCRDLTSIKIPNSVTSIGYRAFSGCTSLTSITIPNSVTSIGYRAFSGCTSLTSITIPESVTSIGEGAFSGCTSLTSIKIPNSIRSIERSAFSGCTSLTSITIPESVTWIGQSAFSGCTGLTSITIPESVTSIGWYAFSGCTGLTSITIPESVTSIGADVFQRCSSLTSIIWNVKAYSDYKSAYGNPFYHEYDIRHQITSFVFGDSVQHIPDFLCAGMENLASITIGNSVTSIGDCAFLKCTGLTSVVWNAKNCNDFFKRITPFYVDLSNIDLRPQITSFVFGDSVQHIPDYLCADMTKLTSLTIPNNVTSIGNDAFSGCSGLTKVNYIGDIKGWLAIDMNSNPISYSHNLYINNKLLTDLIIPEGITYISNFAQCTSLVSVTISNSVTSIGGSAFSGCKNMETVVFGSGVETIGESAFSGCQSIYEMTIYAVKVPTIQENTFTGVGTGATLRVPAGCAKKYKAHPYWGVFNIEEIPSEYTITVTCDPKQGQVTGGGTYTDGSKVTLTAVPNNGYEFKQWSDGNLANPYSFLAEKDVTIEALFEPATPIENVVTEENNVPRKVFRDGQVYILRGEKIYTLTGAEINL